MNTLKLNFYKILFVQHSFNFYSIESKLKLPDHDQEKMTEKTDQKIGGCDIFDFDCKQLALL